MKKVYSVHKGTPFSFGSVLKNAKIGDMIFISSHFSKKTIRLRRKLLAKSTYERYIGEISARIDQR